MSNIKCFRFNSILLSVEKSLWYFFTNVFSSDLVSLTNDVEGSDNEEQDAGSGVALDVRNGGEAENLMDARNSGKFLNRT